MSNEQLRKKKKLLVNLAIITILFVLYIPIPTTGILTHKTAPLLRAGILLKLYEVSLNAFDSNKVAFDFGTLLHHHLNLTCLVTLASG